MGLIRQKNDGKIVNIFLSINLNICSLRCFFLSTHNMFWLKNEKNIFLITLFMWIPVSNFAETLTFS